MKNKLFLFPKYYCFKLLLSFVFIFEFAFAGQLSLNKSDIVALYPIDTERNKAYGQTVSGWGWDPAWWYKSFDELKDYNQSGLNRGMRLVSMNIELSSATAKVLYDKPHLREAVLRDVENKPIAVPWFAPWTHEGIKTLWGCIHHPDYRSHVIEKVMKGIESKTNALHFDMPCGSSRFEYGGCFCDYCNIEFKNYLKNKYDSQTLSRKGVKNIDTYHYRTEVKKVVSTRESSIKAYFDGQAIPLRYDYETFQRLSAGKFIKELGDLVKKHLGPNAPVTTNAWGMTPSTLATCQFSDFFVAEVNHTEHGSELRPDVPIAYKLADAFGKSLAAFGDGPDYHFIESNQAEELIKTWIALAYAFGHQHLVPYGQWVITPDGVQKNQPYTGSTETFSPLYQFIRQHAHLLDHYESIDQVSLLYSSMAIRRGHRDTHQACLDLLNANIPFKLTIAGDDWIQRQLIQNDFSRQKLTVVAGPHELYAQQKDYIEQAFQNKQAIHWSGAEGLLEGIKPWIKLEEGEKIWALPRIHEKDPKAPLVVHLLNRNINHESFSVNDQKNIVLRLSNEILNHAKINKIRFHSIGQDPIELKVKQTKKELMIKVPRLSLWGILEIMD